MNSNSTTVLTANRMNSVYAGGHKVTEVLRDGQWSGQPCFILGGGESLKNFDFHLLQGEKVIAINRAFEHYPDADIWYAMDVALYNQIKAGNLNVTSPLPDVYKTWKEFKGAKIFLCPINHYQFYDKVHFVRRLSEQRFSKSLSEGIFGGNNSGFGALQLALALNANPIFLLGYDFRIVGQTHFHKGYPKQDKEQLKKKLEVYRSKFDEFFTKNKLNGTQVVNLNPNSALQSFPFDHVYNCFCKKIQTVLLQQGQAVIDMDELDRLLHEYKELYCQITTRGRHIMEVFDSILSHMRLHNEEQE